MKDKLFLLKVLDNLKDDQNNSNWRGNLTTWIKCWKNKIKSYKIIIGHINEAIPIWTIIIFMICMPEKMKGPQKAVLFPWLNIKWYNINIHFCIDKF